MAKEYNRQEIYRLAEKYRSERKYRKALKEYQKILAVDSTDIKVINRAADLLHLTGEYMQAIKLYDYLAAAYLKDELLDKVFSIRKQLLELQPKNIARHIDLAKLMVAKGWVADAVDIYKKCLRRFSSSRYFDDRRIILESIVELKNDDFGCRLMLVKIYRQLDYLKDAQRLLIDGLSLMHGRSRSKWRWRYRWQIFKLSTSWKNFTAIFG